jgi:hypothetical protein
VPYFTSHFQAGAPYVNLVVAPSLSRVQALQESKLPVPQPLPVRGLIDTGAAMSTIDTDLVQSLGLESTGSTSVHTAATGMPPQPTSTYDIQIVIVGAFPSQSFTLPLLPVTEASLKAYGFHVLVGRDVLAHCLFVYDGRAGIFSLAF